MSSTVLDRRLGPVDAAAIIISNVVGSGICKDAAESNQMFGDVIIHVP